jgi:HAD superfamily phosphatase
MRAKDFLREELEKMGLGVYPSAANFFLVDFGEKAAFVSSALEQSSILVRDRSSTPGLEGCVRVGVGTMAQCAALVRALQRLLSPKAVIFDVDGVLVDVSRSYRKAIKLTAEHFAGRRVSYRQVQQAKEGGNANNDWVLTKRIIERMGVNVSLEKVKRKFQELYLGAGAGQGLFRNEKWKLRKKVLDALSSTCKLGIVTGRSRHEARLVLDAWGVRDRFLTVIAMEDARGRIKPDPYPLRKAMKELHANRCVYVGDTVDDIEAALRAGCTPVGVVPAGMGNLTDGNALGRKGAVAVLRDVNGIVDVLARVGF